MASPPCPPQAFWRLRGAPKTAILRRQQDLEPWTLGQLASLRRYMIARAAFCISPTAFLSGKSFPQGGMRQFIANRGEDLAPGLRLEKIAHTSARHGCFAGLRIVIRSHKNNRRRDTLAG